MSTDAEIRLVMAEEIMREGGVSGRRRNLDDLESTRHKETKKTVQWNSRTGLIDWSEGRQEYKFDL